MKWVMNLSHNIGVVNQQIKATEHTELHHRTLVPPPCGPQITTCSSLFFPPILCPRKLTDNLPFSTPGLQQRM
jgi:hypothetical protein